MNVRTDVWMVGWMDGGMDGGMRSKDGWSEDEGWISGWMVGRRW